MATTSGSDPTAQSNSGLLFPNFTDGNVFSSLGQFLYWFDFSSGATLVRGPGTLVGIKNRPEAYSPIVTVQQALTPGIVKGNMNGLPTGKANASNHFRGTAQVTAYDQFTAFYVFEGAILTGERIFVLSNTGTTKVGLEADAVEIDGTLFSFVDSATADTLDEARHLVVVKWDGTDVFVKIDDSGFVDIGDQAAPISGIGDVEVLGDGSINFLGDVGEIMFSAELMTDDEINGVGRYLCDKWGTSWSNV